MIFTNENIDRFGVVWLMLFSLSLFSVDLSSGSENRAFADGRNSLTNQYGNYLNGMKRAAGFVGMRGKKANNDLDDLSVNDEDNMQHYFFGPRPARAGFVGMRGKKEDESLYDKRAGFVGMRGKKASDFFPFWFLPQQQSHLGADALEPSKMRRANSGFVGMRGR